jgi:hypothetical protein
MQGGIDGFKVILGIVGRLLTIADGVPLVVRADEATILEPNNLAKWRALHLKFNYVMFRGVGKATTTSTTTTTTTF